MSLDYRTAQEHAITRDIENIVQVNVPVAVRGTGWSALFYSAQRLVVHTIKIPAPRRKSRPALDIAAAMQGFGAECC